MLKEKEKRNMEKYNTQNNLEKSKHVRWLSSVSFCFHFAKLTHKVLEALQSRRIDDEFRSKFSLSHLRVASVENSREKLISIFSRPDVKLKMHLNCQTFVEFKFNAAPCVKPSQVISISFPRGNWKYLGAKAQK